MDASWKIFWNHSSSPCTVQTKFTKLCSCTDQSSVLVEHLCSMVALSSAFLLKIFEEARQLSTLVNRSTIKLVQLLFSFPLLMGCQMLHIIFDGTLGSEWSRCCDPGTSWCQTGRGHKESKFTKECHVKGWVNLLGLDLMRRVLNQTVWKCWWKNWSSFFVGDRGMTY